MVSRFEVLVLLEDDRVSDAVLRAHLKVVDLLVHVVKAGDDLVLLEGIAVRVLGGAGRVRHRRGRLRLRQRFVGPHGGRLGRRRRGCRAKGSALLHEREELGELGRLLVCIDGPWGRGAGGGEDDGVEGGEDAFHAGVVDWRSLGWERQVCREECLDVLVACCLEDVDVLGRVVARGERLHQEGVVGVHV